MNSDGLDARYELAVDLAAEAGALALHMRHALGPLEVKNPIDFATAADHAVEALIRDRVRTAFGDGVIGEEAGGEASDSVWVVDPIDGTAGYIHGTPRWCVSLAYVQDGATRIGVIFDPTGNRMFAARDGGGAWLNGRRMGVSRLRHGAAPVVEVGWSGRCPLSRYSAVLQHLTERGMEFRRHGSGALALAEVALGYSDAYIELHMNAWDALAGLLLVQEAGGQTNDFMAGNGLTEGNLVLAATPEVAPHLAEMLGVGLLRNGGA